MGDSSSRDPLEMLADEFIRRRRSGETLSLNEFAHQHPDHASDIQELFPLMMDIEQLKSAAKTTSAAILAAPQIERLGDFRILREIGRGGMGIVFEAEQESLSRRVALKVISSLGPNSESQSLRFRREAEAAARLHHTHIVPVYSVGQNDHWQFFAMQFIEGAGLDRVILELKNRQRKRHDANDLTRNEESAIAVDTFASTNASNDRVGAKNEVIIADGLLGRQVNHHDSLGYWKQLACIAADIADGLGYAHQQGMLHRDIKPANLLLDLQLQGWITDFGLAKPISSDDLTRTGEILGTFRYMAPEQLRGHADERTDIYSLGVTLFELLTLRPAFDETDCSRLVQQKTVQSIPRLRQLNRDIPRDLETIVLKAADIEPARRYSNFQTMAADLRAFLEDLPIKARPIGSIERAWRWCRRNPAIAVSSFSAIAMLLVAIGILSWSNYRTGSALVETQSANEQAEKSRRRAEDNLNLAIDAFDHIVDSISKRGVPQSLHLEQYRQENAPRFISELTQDDIELLTRLLTFYAQFSMHNQGDQNVAERTAAAHHRIGLIQQRLGDTAAAIASFDQGLFILEALRKNDPTRLSLVVSTAKLMNDKGLSMTESLSPIEQIIELHLKVVEFLMSQNQKISQHPNVQLELARAHDLAGSSRFRQKIARSGVRLAGAPLSPPVNDQTNNPSIPIYLSQPREFNQAQLRKGREILNELVSSNPENAEYRLLKAQVERHWLAFIQLDNEPSNTAEAFHAARIILEKLVQDFPNDPLYQAELADTLSMVSTRLSSVAPDEAIRYLSEAIDLSKKLTSLSPTRDAYRALSVTCFLKLARIYRSQNEFDLAYTCYTTAGDLLGDLVSNRPTHAYYQTNLMLTTAELSDLLREQNERTHDKTYLEESKTLLESAIHGFVESKDLENDPYRRQIAIMLYHGFARTLRALGEEHASGAANAAARKLSGKRFP